MRNRKIQRMVKRGEITHEEGVLMAAGKFNKNLEKPISYRNHERYSDPTAYAALNRVIRDQRKTTKKGPSLPGSDKHVRPDGGR